MTDHSETFELEPPAPGHVPERVIDELRRAYRQAKDLATAFSESVKAQAEKHGVKPAALRRYVAALESGDIAKVAKEIDDLNRLIDEGGSE